MQIKEIVKEKYGQAALRVTTGGSSCCGATAHVDGCCVDPITSNLYDAGQAGQVPEEFTGPQAAVAYLLHVPRGQGGPVHDVPCLSSDIE